jgi:hypothetical protein
VRRLAREDRDLILIRVLHPALFLQDRPASWANDAPLETVTIRSGPMGCGPTVDQARPLSGPVRLGQWALDSGDRADPSRPPSLVVRPGLIRGP